jgi:hypothetical protein
MLLMLVLWIMILVDFLELANLHLVVHLRPLLA